MHAGEGIQSCPGFDECMQRMPDQAVLSFQVWAAPLVGGVRAVVLFNRHVSSDEKFDEHNMTLHWSMIGLPEDLEVNRWGSLASPMLPYTPRNV